MKKSQPKADSKQKEQKEQKQDASESSLKTTENSSDLNTNGLHDTAKSLEEIRRLSKEFLSDVSKANNIVSLVKLIDSDHDEACFSAMKAAQQCFKALGERVPLSLAQSPQPPPADAAGQLRLWAGRQLVLLSEALERTLSRAEPTLQVAALEQLLGLVRQAAAQSPSSARLSSQSAAGPLARVVRRLVRVPLLHAPLLAPLAALLPLADVSFFVLRALRDDLLQLETAQRAPKRQTLSNPTSQPPTTTALATSVSTDNAPLAVNVYEVLRLIQPPSPTVEMQFLVPHPHAPRPEKPVERVFGEGDDEEDLSDEEAEPAPLEPSAGRQKRRRATGRYKEDYLLLDAHRHMFSDTWLAFLRMSGMSGDTYKRVLSDLCARVLPHFEAPMRLLDFLRDSYDRGGVVSMLALEALFTLITKHNLDLPDFYPRLYALFQPNIFHVKHRDRFFQLAAKFLSSSHLPIYMICAFVKRLARLCLTAPAYGPLVALPMIYNLLRKHPKALQLLHRDAPGTAGDAPVLLIDEELKAHQAQIGRDPYIFEEKDLQKCRAVDSSLWELEALLHHFHPSVVRMAQLFDNTRLQKQPFDINAFSKLSYQSEFESQLHRKSSAAPLATEKPSGFAGNETSDPVTKYWALE